MRSHLTQIPAASPATGPVLSGSACSVGRKLTLKEIPLQFNPQSNPQNAMSYTTSANFGSPRGSVNALKSLVGLD